MENREFADCNLDDFISKNEIAICKINCKFNLKIELINLLKLLNYIIDNKDLA